MLPQYCVGCHNKNGPANEKPTGEHDHPVPVRAEAMAMASRAAVTPPAMESGTSRVVVQASGAIRLVR